MIVLVIFVVDICRHVLYIIEMRLDKHSKFKFAV